MLIYLGWIVAAFLAGVLLMLFLQRRKPSLQQRVMQMGVFAGRSYAEILKAMDAPQTAVQQTDGRTFILWLMQRKKRKEISKEVNTNRPAEKYRSKAIYRYGR